MFLGCIKQDCKLPHGSAVTFALGSVWTTVSDGEADEVLLAPKVVLYLPVRGWGDFV